MEILMVALELSPFARETDAGDAVASLSKALRQLGHNVTVAIPRQPGFDESGLLMARRLTPLPLPDGGEVPVLDAQLPSGVQVTLFDAPVLFDRPSPYSTDGVEHPDNAQRFALLSQAAAALVRQRAAQGTAFDIVHLHDAPAALFPAALARIPGPSVPTVLTIHDADRPGRGDDELEALRTGITQVDVVTTVSPTYAAALTTALCVSPDKPIVGISNGVDHAVHNPATDSALASRYNAEDASHKGVCKSAVLRELELPIDIDRPLLLIDGPLTPTSGLDLVLAAMSGLLKTGTAVVVASELPAAAAKKLKALRTRRRDDFAWVERTTVQSRHRLYAAADLALIAPRHAPCGNQQLIAQRYGALPIARAVGGINDTVVDCDASLETGTGFLFDDESEEALLGAVGRALTAFGSASLPGLRRRIMRLDLGWDRPARRYLQVYRQALGAGR
jgi:starch synthase